MCRIPIEWWFERSPILVRLSRFRTRARSAAVLSDNAAVTFIVTSAHPGLVLRNADCLTISLFDSLGQAQRLLCLVTESTSGVGDNRRRELYCLLAIFNKLRLVFAGH